MHCFLSHPILPRPTLKTRTGDQQTVEIKIREGNPGQFGIVRGTTKPGGGSVEEIIPLPKRPEGCPPWKYALTLPAKAQNQNAIIFLAGKYRWIWLTDARAQIPWKTSTQAILPEIVRASVATNKQPHKIFLEECLEIKKRWEGKEKKPTREDPWPHLMRLRWLEMLLACDSTPEQEPDREQILQVKVPANHEKLKNIISETRKAAAVSLAAFTPGEIPLAIMATGKS